MADVPADRVGMLVIRAWVEGGSSSPLRARVRWTTDVSAGFEQSLTAVEVDAVLSSVETWLDEVLARGRRPGGAAGGGCGGGGGGAVL